MSDVMLFPPGHLCAVSETLRRWLKYDLRLDNVDLFGCFTVYAIGERDTICMSELRRRLRSCKRQYLENVVPDRDSRMSVTV